MLAARERTGRARQPHREPLPDQPLPQAPLPQESQDE
jgi:hypothetical protein